MKSEAQKALIDWRRSQVIQYYSVGKLMTVIATFLKIDVSTVSRDLEYLRKQAKESISTYLSEELPFQHNLSVSTIETIMKDLWALAEKE